VQVALDRRTENACRYHPPTQVRTCRARRRNTNVGSFPRDCNVLVYFALTCCCHLLRIIFFGRHLYGEGGRSIANTILLATRLSSSPSFSPLIARKNFLPESLTVQAPGFAGSVSRNAAPTLSLLHHTLASYQHPIRLASNSRSLPFHQKTKPQHTVSRMALSLPLRPGKLELSNFLEQVH
jgi:hypothetical protein